MSEWQTELDSMKAADEEDRPQFAKGGIITGPAVTANDSIPIRVTPGEVWLSREQAASLTREQIEAVHGEGTIVHVIDDPCTHHGPMLCPDCGHSPTLVMGSVHHCGTCDRVLIAEPGRMRRPTVIEARRIYELPVIRSLLGLKPSSTTTE